MGEPNGIRRLREAGLSVGSFNIERDLAELEAMGTSIDRRDWEGQPWYGYCVVKPVTAPGNRRPHFQKTIVIGPSATDRILTDAPNVHVCTIYPDSETWHLWVRVWPGDNSPGAFDQTYLTVDEAAEAAFSYFFGDASRMNPPEVMEDVERRRQWQAWMQRRRELYETQHMQIAVGKGLKYLIFRIMPLFDKARRGLWWTTLCMPLIRLRYFRLHQRGWNFGGLVSEGGTDYFTFWRDIPRRDTKGDVSE
jgi:hypothetical protein